MSGLHKKKQQVVRRRKSLIASGLLLSIWIGYQLANRQVDQLEQKITNQASTIDNLNAEYHRLTQQLNQQNAKQLVCDAQLQQADQQSQQLIEQQQQCKEEVALYQYVMAPELSGDMLSVEVASVQQSTAENSSHILNLVLLQPRLQKAVISGDLQISVKYSDSDIPVKLLSSPYRFKFFQQSEVAIRLAENRQPKTLIFYSEVFQYGTKREVLDLELTWDGI